MADQKEITLAGEKVILSPRCVLDVSTTSNFVQEHLADADNTQNLYVMASIVADAIKQTVKRFKWWQIFRKARYNKITAIWLIQKLPSRDLVSAYESVLELEGIDLKKKLKETET